MDPTQLERNSVFTILPALQWYKPYDREEIEDMAYFGFDWPVDAEWAKKRYPQLKDAIAAEARRSVYQAPSSGGYSDIYQGQVYARPIVTMCHFWLRNREVPMTDQEGIGAGILESRPMPMEAPNATPGAAPTPPADNPMQPATGADGIAPDVSGGGGLPGEQAAPANPAPTDAIFHKESGQQIDESHELWPTKYVTSHTVQIANAIVLDEEWPGWDIPIVTNYNVRVPNRPYGQSECIRVRTIQTDINSVHASTVKHGNWFSGPTSMLPKSIQASLPEGAKNRGMRPNETLWVNDADLKKLLEMFGNRDILGLFTPPPLSPALVQVMDRLESAFDNAGGQSKVKQGISPTANASGELAKTLLDAGQQQDDYAALDLEEMAWRVGNIFLHHILDTWEVADYLKINQTFDPQTVQIIINTARQMEFAIDVDASVAKQQKQQQVRQDFQIGLVDKETARDIAGYDSAQIEQREMESQQQALEAQAAVAGAQGSEQSQLQSQGQGQQPARKGSLKLAGATA